MVQKVLGTDPWEHRYWICYCWDLSVEMKKGNNRAAKRAKASVRPTGAGFKRFHLNKPGQDGRINPRYCDGGEAAGKLMPGGEITARSVLQEKSPIFSFSYKLILQMGL